jgi:hypothetical protein
MRILILDDEQCRHDALGAFYVGHSVAHTTTYEEFLHELSCGSPWDLVSLDHDLGEGAGNNTYVDGWGDSRFFSGQHASLRICELTEDRLPREVVVHSVNPEGARAMVMNLTRRNVKVTWRPYTAISFEKG